MNNKMTVNTYLSTTALNANGLNAPIKRHMVAEQDLSVCCLQETYFRSKNTD